MSDLKAYLWSAATVAEPFKPQVSPTLCSNSHHLVNLKVITSMSSKHHAFQNDLGDLNSIGCRVDVAVCVWERDRQTAYIPCREVAWVLSSQHFWGTAPGTWRDPPATGHRSPSPESRYYSENLHQLHGILLPSSSSFLPDAQKLTLSVQISTSLS